MKVEEIERLLAEFYEGNTNEQEEELLKEAFRTEEVPEHLQKDKKLFLSFFPGEVVDNVPAGLEDKLSRMIDEKAEEEQRFFHRNKAKRNWRWIGGIAATILVLVGVGYGITNMGEDMRPPTPQDTFSDPEAAYKALQATLIEVSANLNKGIEQIEETRIDVTKVKAETRIKTLEWQDAREKIELQVNQSVYKVNEAGKKLIASSRNMENAEENLRRANFGFEEGVIPALNLMEAQTAWVSARSSLIDAQIEVKLTEVYLSKALGKLSANE